MENSQQQKTELTFLLLEAANLEVDSKIGKDRHFIAADRKNKLRITFGLFSVIATAIIASKAVKETFQILQVSTQYETLSVSVLTLLVGLSTAILGFFGLEKQVSQHRYVGNYYIEISRKSRRLINKIQEGLNTNDANKILDDLLVEYSKANKEGEACPTSKKDSEKSLALNADSRSKVKGKIKNLDSEAMNFTATSVEKTSLIQLISYGLKAHLASLALKLKLLNENDFELYLNKLKK